jgi:hypothetical protein
MAIPNDEKRIGGSLRLVPAPVELDPAEEDNQFLDAIAALRKLQECSRLPDHAVSALRSTASLIGHYVDKSPRLAGRGREIN